MDLIVKIAGSIFCLGVGSVLLALGTIMISVFVVEVYNKIKS